MTLIIPLFPRGRLMPPLAASPAAPFLVGPVAVAELAVKLPALTAALLEEGGR